MAKLTLEVVKGKLVAVTSKGVAVLMGTPEFIVNKYGLYLVFPEVADEALLTEVKGHKIYHEFKVDGASVPVFRQMRKSGDLLEGAWHINASDINIPASDIKE
jgi:hypothetical protein